MPLSALQQQTNDPSQQSLHVTLESLKLQIGDEVHLEFQEPVTRHVVRLIGYLPGHSVLVSSPTQGGKSMIVKADRPVTVRLMANDRVCGFVTNVRKQSVTPFPYLHLGWPLEVETLRVREHRRIEMSLIASVDQANAPPRQPGWPKAVTVKDLSAGGAGLISGQWLGDKGSELKMALRLTVAGQPVTTELTMIVRNVEEQADVSNTRPIAPGRDHYIYGVQFTALSQETRLTLVSFLFEQLMQANGG